MAFNFDAALARADAAFAATFGDQEGFVWTPMFAVPNGKPAPDETRPVQAIDAIWHEPYLHEMRIIGDTGRAGRSRTNPVISVNNLAVKRFDRFQRRKTLILYEATEIQSDGSGWSHVDLVEVRQ